MRKKEYHNKGNTADRCAPADFFVRSEKMKKLFLVFYSFVIAMCVLPAPVALSSDKDCNKDVEAFLQCNNPRVSKYLARLTTKDIGKVLTGVRLTDGSTELKGYTFLGEARDITKGAHLYIFKFKKHRSAYIWVDEKGTELPLPSCPESVSFESAYVLSGDVYTWKALQPGHGIVHVMCIDDLWMNKIK
jgi:hypothetical protein